MPDQFKAIVECLDSGSSAAIMQLDLPTYEGRLAWVFSRIDPGERARKADVVFIVASRARASAVAERVIRHRDANHIAIGACTSRRDGAGGATEGVVRLRPDAWKQDVRMLLTSVTATLCESQPEVVVCIDWGDFGDLLNLPGELILDWLLEPNAKAVRTVLDRVQVRLSGRKCRGMLCLLSGGRRRWFKELRVALRTCRDMLDGEGILLGGDRLAPFCGGPGCCLLAVADKSLPKSPVRAR